MYKNYMNNLDKVCKILRDNDYTTRINELEKAKKKLQINIIYDSEDELDLLKETFLKKLNPATSHDNIIPFTLRFDDDFYYNIFDALMNLTKSQNEYWVESTSTLITNIYISYLFKMNYKIEMTKTIHNNQSLYLIESDIDIQNETNKLWLKNQLETDIESECQLLSVELFDLIRSILFKEVYYGEFRNDEEIGGLLYDNSCFKCKSCKQLYTKFLRNYEKFNLKYSNEKNLCIDCSDN